MSQSSLLLQSLRERVLLCDGGFGSRIQAMSLDVAKDYWGQENCTEILNLSRPDVVREVHRGYFAAGADMVETNSFGGSPITLGEFDLTDKALEINRTAAHLAREAAEMFQDGRQRFVVGSIGPGTKLPTLGHISYAALEAAFMVQAEGLIAGGVDACLIETCQDLLQVKAAINGVKLARAKLGANTPIFVQVTVETTGTLLVGADIAASATALGGMDIDSLGLNCATGPLEMAEHVKWLSQNWGGLISVQPNAGLPELVNGKTHYPLTAPELAAWMKRFIVEDGVNLVGGCCGTTDAHIQAVDAMLRELDGAGRPVPVARQVHVVPAVASLYGQVALRQENSIFSIGERCNANGSKAWRQAQEAQDWEACVGMAKEQMQEGSNALDICTAFVGRDEAYEMCAVLPKIAKAVTTPLVIDSTEYSVLEQALALYGGKAILNSINFEDGEEPASARLKLAKKFGAAVIALTIDEVGMAKKPEDKLRIAKRLYEFAKAHGVPASDLLIDPLTFTIATGNSDDRKLGLWTLEGIELIAKELPDVQILLGLSNISFGLSAHARHVLNSVFLDHAQKRGMTAAIVHVSKIMPLHKIDAAEVKAAENLIYDVWENGQDPLQAFIALFAGREATAKVAKARPEKVEDRLSQRIIDGDKVGLEDDLALAMQSYTPLQIINEILLGGMKVVGELFGAGKMQLPFVLQSAETMKAAVAWLEPHMERVEGQEKGTIVLATVKGDVHDIGKNLVDIILTNNGYKVVNLGIKQPVANIIQAACECKAHAVGMSGLLVKSTVVMKENLEEMSRQGLSVPVLLGGAALTRNFVEQDCAQSYSTGSVAYAKDAFDGLDLMDKVVEGSFADYCRAMVAKSGDRQQRKKIGTPTASAPMDKAEAAARRQSLYTDVPTPPFFGHRLIEKVEVEALLPFLNERMLYQLQWGYRKDGRSFEDYLQWAQQELKPVLIEMLQRCAAENILQPQAVYGFYKAAAEGDDLLLFAEDGTTELARFTLPRQAEGERISIVDYVRDISAGPQARDVLGLQIATMGQRVADVARDWFAQNLYQDYLYLHGIGVELTEALAEYVHRRIRSELGFGHMDAREKDKLLQQGYQGSRYSFGYPACPNLEDQVPILKLLGAERIGVELSDGFQLHPEQSTSAIVLHHPKARYFSV